MGQHSGSPRAFQQSPRHILVRYEPEYLHRTLSYPASARHRVYYRGHRKFWVWWLVLSRLVRPSQQRQTIPERLIRRGWICFFLKSSFLISVGSVYKSSFNVSATLSMKMSVVK